MSNKLKQYKTRSYSVCIDSKGFILQFQAMRP